ncbi:hypothetical protein DXM29_20455 [Agrobacterium tumefaciens]|uniref:hypothetical protein n=1 Tax=Agrobacterium tumefaciens TaxID=358 RepID=UPI0012301409|nr:hypothetical protein DXM29_20455 [Agrobacterium tumefaciens]
MIPTTRNMQWVLPAAMLGLLLLLNVLLYNRPIDISPVALDHDTPSSAEGALLMQGAGKGVGEISHTLARPLFSPTRREFVAEAQQLTPTPTEHEIKTTPSDQTTRPALTLQGTRFIGQEGRALVALEPEHVPIWVKIGDLIKGWTVAKVSKDGLVLTIGEQRAVYALYEGSDAAPDTGTRETSANGR